MTAISQCNVFLIYETGVDGIACFHFEDLPEVRYQEFCRMHQRFLGDASNDDVLDLFLDAMYSHLFNECQDHRITAIDQPFFVTKSTVLIYTGQLP